MGWFEVGERVQAPPTAEEINRTIEQHLISSAWAVAVDNVSMTKEERAAWLDFRQALSDIPNQVGYPENVIWPTEPPTT